jgi:predicted Zn-dependent peptidase
LSRRDAEAHFAAHYRPEYLTAVLVGELDSAEVARLARRYFGRLARGTAQPSSAIPSPERGGAERREVFTCDCAPQMRILHHTVPFGHPDTYALDVLSGLLNGRSGRLHRSLVLRRGAAFSAFARHEALRRGGSFVVSAEARGGASPEDLEVAWKQELKRLQEEPVALEELEKVKNQISTEAYRRLREPAGLMLELLHSAGLGDWTHVDRWPEGALAVIAEDVGRVARTYFGEAGRTVALFRRASERSTEPSP